MPNVLSLLLVTLLVFNYIVPFADLDYTWQIRTGEEVLRTGQLRPVEAFSYTIPGKEVPEFEWLYEVTLALIWRAFGYGGLKLMKTILVATPMVLLGWRLRREGVRWYGIALALLTSILVLSPAWNLRPMYCTTIGLLLVSGWLHEHCRGRRAVPWTLPVAMLIWANCHPGVIAGQALLIGAISWEWLNRLLRFNPPLDNAACWRLTLVGGLGLLATFVSPDPIERLVYPFSPDVRHPIQRIFTEMQPMSAMLRRGYVTIALVYVLAAAVAFTWVVRFRHYRLWEIAYLLGLAGLASMAVRSMQDMVYGFLSLGYAHIVFTFRLHVLEHRHKRSWLYRFDRLCRHGLESSWFRLQPGWLWATFAGLAVVSLIPPVSRAMPIQESRDCPKRALDWIEQQGLQGNFFGSPDYGSYTCWRLGERARCYVDTRGFFFPGELIEDSHYIPQMGPGWQKRLERVERFGTDYLLLETQGSRGQLWRTLQAQIPDPLYVDDQAVLLTMQQLKQVVGKMAR